MTSKQITDLIESLRDFYPRINVTTPLTLETWHAELKNYAYEDVLTAYQNIVSNSKEDRLGKYNISPLAVFKEYYQNVMFLKKSTPPQMKYPVEEIKPKRKSSEAYAFQMFLWHVKYKMIEIPEYEGSDLLNLPRFFDHYKKTWTEAIEKVRTQEGKDPIWATPFEGIREKLFSEFGQDYNLVKAPKWLI